ncbi:MAG TPA: SpvB/TcaC N-terminal domain-containing protein [Pyrinomonadaceae bacterium]|nr:SpvB/TcaC N-terminal domain-containing protein [Pyrinomonadaceae bacterium]
MQADGATDKTTDTPAGPAPPTISLPRGGGAIRGIGEKFAANPVSGSGSMNVPLVSSPGRSGFGPQLSLSYDSGAGNGPFGLGWSLSLPAITRKTEKGIPRYQDADESDVFILSGAEDLVPVLADDGSVSVTNRAGFQIRRYRPRVEGLFARIERWTNDAGETHWRSITKENVTTIYGQTDKSQIRDPDNSLHVFSWLICESYDDRGNAIRYEYLEEDSAGVVPSSLNERNRTDQSRKTNRYLKRIKYCPSTPRQENEHLAARSDWLMEVVFDYGEHDVATPAPEVTAGQEWSMRADPFSTYRAGFEVRTYRLCRRVLMFHRFRELGGGPCLVASTDFQFEQTPITSFLTSVSQSGYVRLADKTYLKKSMPAVEFTYSKAIIEQKVRELDAESVENLPTGLDGANYQWVDLDGDGVAGILSEQAAAWFYKRNLSPKTIVEEDNVSHTIAKLGPVETIALLPSFKGATTQFMDLEGDGQPDRVQFDGPLPGFFEREHEGDWALHRPFTSLPNVDWNDANLKFIDLTGDGRTDLLISEDNVFTWYPSLGEAGFAARERAFQRLDQEKGPRLVVADQAQAIFLADLSGDGLIDIVRVRNGEICYWPNLGYGRFGAKVTMDNPPLFDRVDEFDQRRIRLADIDGSGVTDIIYLHGEGVRIYFNQSGNGWSDAVALNVFPQTENLSSVAAVDLLGNGTACLVWSSPLPGHAAHSLKYVDLMGGTKPHLMVSSRNNLGAETKLHYAPSTKFYLQDKYDGNPWITKLPFPVHVVEYIETFDYVSRNHFVTRYAYHHGYFDGPEREFRGFGMVEQWDTDTFNRFEQPATNTDEKWQVPPAHTRTWFHTGAYFEGAQISRHLAHEYFGAPQDETAFQVWLRENLLDDTVLPEDLTADEQRQACRALKGMMLRQEVYADDGSAKAAIPYTVTEQNFTIRRVQRKANNRHAVFFTHPREAINFSYERNLNDPRISHTITLECDEYGNMLKQVAIGYGRSHADAALPTQADREKQTTTLITYTENRLTKAIDDPALFPSDYRTPLPSETRVFELSGYVPTGPGGRFQSSDFVEPDTDEPGRVRLKFLVERAYEDTATGAQQRRPIELMRTLYRKNDLTALCSLDQLESLALPGESYKLAFTPGLLATVYQRPRADGSLENLIPDPDALLGSQTHDGGGYVKSQTLKTDGRFPAGDPDDHWWIPTGRAFFRIETADDPAAELLEARRNFFLPRRYRDPFGHDISVTFDAYNLLTLETGDALGNRITAGERAADGTINAAVPGNDYRVLQPVLVTDPNRNRTQVVFDALGMLVGTAVMGKPGENVGDSLEGFIADLDDNINQYHLANPLNNPAHPLHDPANPLQTPQGILSRATTRLIYDLFAYQRTRNLPEPQPAAIYTLARETHHANLAQNEISRFQHSFSYSDGFSREIQKKIQAERGPLVDGGPNVERWVGTGWTIFNNKGKPVQKFEPFFTATHGYEYNARAGVSPVLFYDPVERVVATLLPNHTYEKVVFDAWRQTAYDVNDTVTARSDQTGDPRTDPDIRDFTAGYFAHLPPSPPAPPWQTWFEARKDGLLGPSEQTAAVKAAAHADTPTTAYFDTLGRPFLTFSDNGPDPAQPGQRLLFATRVELDIEGNQRAVRDAMKEARDGAGNQLTDERGRIVMRYEYDQLGNRIQQSSMEAGVKWLLNDATGKPIRAWDSRGHNFVSVYDELRRPVEQYVRGTSAESDPRTTSRDILIEKAEYGEGQANAETLNVRTRIFRQSDSAGVITNVAVNPNSSELEAYDFKGNLLRSTRRLARDYTAIPDWSLSPELEDETFTTSTRFDALNRPIQHIAPHSDLARAKRNIVQPVFNEANLLERVQVWLERDDEPVGLLDPATVAASPVGVTNIDYNEKGQRVRIDYLNRASTFYEYDESTLRLIHLLTSRHAPDFPEDCPQQPPSGWPGCQIQNLHYTYDPAGNITHIRDDAQQTIFFRNQRVEPSAEFTYDAAYRLIEATGREHLGQVGRAPTPYSHDDAPRVGIDWAANDGLAMARYCENYVYDAAGNIREMIHRRSCPGVASWTRTYAYGETSLIENGAGGGSVKNNNRLSNTTVGSNNPSVEDYRYDTHGNMVRMPHLGRGLPDPNMYWNYRDQMRQTDLGGGGIAWHVYDVTGKRVRKVVEKSPGLIEERIYFGGFEIFRRHASAIGAGSVTLERETLHIMDDKRRVTLVETRTFDTTNDQAPRQLIRYQFENHLNSASLELDHQAQIVSYEEYTPYGATSYQAVRSQTETKKRYRFTGKERDEESGFYYHGARYYAPWLGRWTSCDPLTLVDGPNLYQYSRNRPLVLIDPNGTEGGDPSKDKKKAPQKEQKKPSAKKLVSPEETKKTLERKYGITIEKGDKDWSASDIEDLKWALEQLKPKEAEVLKGYRFLRWKDRESRKEHDPDYSPKGEEEAGLHEFNMKEKSFKISLYDLAFDPNTTFHLEVDGQQVGEAQLQSRLDTLHEIGHALATADYRKAATKYKAAETAHNDLIDKFDAATSTKEQKQIKKQYEKAKTELAAREKELDAVKPEDNLTAAEREFKSLAQGMAPVTEYAGTNAKEGFAETFAMYKLNRLGIEKMNPKLAEWFKNQGYLKVR